jgi:uncharacterized protein with von Willebrand factor type A (vWA) domain
MPALAAKQNGKWVHLKKEWLINVSQRFLNDSRTKKITALINIASRLIEVTA